MTADRAKALHERAIVIDGHSDILIPLADGLFRFGERPDVPAPEQWDGVARGAIHDQATPFQLSPYAMTFQCLGQYDIPRLREGGVTAQVMAIFIGDEYGGAPLQRALDMARVFHREIDDNPDHVLLATSADDIRRAKAENKTALILSFEGVEPLELNPRLIEIFYRLGLRIVSLTHSRRNHFADGTQLGVRTGGLTRLGQELVTLMNELGIVIDLAHLADDGFWEILELSSAPVILSHTNVLRGNNPDYKVPLLAINPATGVSKLQALAANGGVAGAIFWSQPDLDAIVEDIEAMIEHVGDDHVGLGSDFFSLEYAPAGLEDISKLPRLTERLAQRGHSDATILKILGGNYMRVFDEVLKG